MNRRSTCSPSIEARQTSAQAHQNASCQQLAVGNFGNQAVVAGPFATSISRAYLAHATPPASDLFSTDSAQVSLTSADLAAFVDQLIASDLDAAWAVVQTMQSQGASGETVILELFGAAARLLGKRWEDDDSSFADVTIAMTHLGAFLRRNSESFIARGQRDRLNGRILLAHVPGEQHTFGLNVASDYFLRAGFDVHSGSGSCLDDLLDQVRESAFDAIGFTLGSMRHAEALQRFVGKIKKASGHTEPAVVLGGPVFAQEPDLHRELGADLLITDIREAPGRVMALAKTRRRSVMLSTHTS